jgi:hypothetical protein
MLDAPHASPELVMEKAEVDELAEKTKAAGSPRARLYRGMAESHPGGGYRLYRLRRFAKEMEALPGQVEVSQADYPLVDARPGLDTLKALRIQWVVTSNWGADPSRVPELRTFFDELYGQAQLVRDFTPEADARGGPVLRIFKLR